MSRPRIRIAIVATVAAICCLAATPAIAGPVTTRVVEAPGELVAIPAAIPHQEGAMIDNRIVPDLRWIAAHFPVYVTEGYSGPLADGQYVGCHGCHVRHSDHYNGLAVDIVPVQWSATCDANWRGITRLARWAEPSQNRPLPPFRWVGYDGDAGHGCGNHLHLSWEHAAAPPFQLAEWVEVFPVDGERLAQPSNPRRHRQSTGPPGGISRAEMGGVSARME